MTPDALAPLLRCPACGGRLTLTRAPQPDPEAGDCGVLHCACSASYPVLDGVPVLRSGPLHRRSIADHRVLAPGPDVAGLTARVERGRALDALVDVLAAPLCPWPLNRVGPVRQLALREPIRSAGLALRRRRVRAMLRDRDRLTAEDWLAAFYLHAPEVYDPFNYFFFRFGTPRHLATLGLLEALPAPDGRPALDLACGYGHFLHALTVGHGRPAVGLDQNAHQAWVARHYVAPGAAVVVADAARPLPFADGAFAAGLVIDAFQYLADKPGVLAELDRVSGRGPTLIASAGNAGHALAEDQDLPPDGYAALFDGRPWRVQTESDLLARYFDGLGPDLSASSDPAAIARSRFLYYALDPSGQTLRAHGPLGGWPHAAGALTLHPLYEPGQDRFELQMPSPWFEAENGALRDYMPATVGAGEALTPALVSRAAAVGLPDRYARRERPWTQRADTALVRLAHRLRRPPARPGPALAPPRLAR